MHKGLELKLLTKFETGTFRKNCAFVYSVLRHIVFAHCPRGCKVSPIVPDVPVLLALARIDRF